VAHHRQRGEIRRNRLRGDVVYVYGLGGRSRCACLWVESERLLRRAQEGGRRVAFWGCCGAVVVLLRKGD
jgi:hypothetical protein